MGQRANEVPMRDDGIARFWHWWPTARGRIEASITSGGADEALIAEITDRVDAISEGLAWELAPGATAQHAFCLSSNGDPERRILTETWRLRGPGADATWEFHGARQGGGRRANLVLELEGFAVALAELAVAFEVDTARERIDGIYFHPTFEAMDDDTRTMATFLALDGAFGEDGVERWLGSIETATERPDGALPITDLEVAVTDLARTATGESFAILQGEDDEGAPVFVTLNQALKRVDHLLCTMHVAIDVAILGPTAAGLTTAEDATALDALEDELFAQLGSTAVYFGRETRRGRRILHLFAPEDGPAAGILDRWAAAHADRDVHVTWQRDPTWELLDRFG